MSNSVTATFIAISRVYQRWEHGSEIEALCDAKDVIIKSISEDSGYQLNQRSSNEINC